MILLLNTGLTEEECDELEEIDEEENVKEINPLQYLSDCYDNVRFQHGKLIMCLCNSVY